MKNIFYMFSRKIVFFLLLFLIFSNGSKVFAAHRLIDCPCSGGANADVICHNGWVCPNGYKKYESGGDLLNCESGLCGDSCCDSGDRCCFKEDMVGCPDYSICFAEEPTGYFPRWVDIGKTCEDYNGEQGKCYIPKSDGLDECLPIPDQCHSINCNYPKACVKSNHDGGGTLYYKCVVGYDECQPCNGCCAVSSDECDPPGDYDKGSGMCAVGETCFVLVSELPTCAGVGGICRHESLCNTSPPNVEKQYGGATSDCNETYPNYYFDVCCVPDTSYACGTPGKPCCEPPEELCSTYGYYCDDVTKTCITHTCGLDGQECCLSGDPCSDSGLECIEVSGVNTCVRKNPPGPPSLIYKGPVIENLEDIIGPVAAMLYYGGLAIGFFFIILSGYRLMTSEGDPQRVKGAQEQLTSAIIGIVFILLSVTIIRIIMDSILNI